jgi:hypothetical protein
MVEKYGREDSGKRQEARFNRQETRDKRAERREKR